MKFSSVLIGGALALALIAPAASLAQQSPAPANAAPERGHRTLPGLRGITLTDAQTAQIKTITEQFRTAHPRGSAPDPDARKAMIAQVMGVLTPDQQTQFKANMAKMRHHREGDETQPDPSPSPQS